MSLPVRGSIRILSSSSRDRLVHPASATYQYARLPGHVSARTLMTMRRWQSFWAPGHATNFWSQSYLPTKDKASEGPWVPAVPPSPAPTISVMSAPPLPSPSAVTERAEEPEEDPHTKRKQRYLDSLMDKADEVTLRCSILDARGNWTAEEGKYKKLDLCRAHDLDPRDLRKLDSITPSVVPIILTRRSCILISMLNIRALIKPDRVIVFDVPGVEDSPETKRFKTHLQNNIRALNRQGAPSPTDDGELSLQYEHRALESILVSTANSLEEEMDFVRGLVADLLGKLEHDINRDTLRQLLHYSRRLAGFQSRAKYVRSAVDELLDSDEDLSAMYLTDKMRGRPRAIYDHEQLELLFESFVKQVEEIVSEIDWTSANMQSTQEVAELMLDSSRNALLALDIKVSMATLGTGAAALVAGIFGMNLATSLENSQYAFGIVSGGAALFAILITLWGMRVVRKVGRVSLISKPTSSLRSAKEKFLRERAYQQMLSDRAEAAARDAASAASAATAATWVRRPIPDYDARWRLVRRNLKSRSTLWDRLFHPQSFRRTLLGIRRGPVMLGKPHAKSPVLWVPERFPYDPSTNKTSHVAPKDAPADSSGREHSHRNVHHYGENQSHATGATTTKGSSSSPPSHSSQLSHIPSTPRASRPRAEAPMNTLPGQPSVRPSPSPPKAPELSRPLSTLSPDVD